MVNLRPGSVFRLAATRVVEAHALKSFQVSSAVVRCAYVRVLIINESPDKSVPSTRNNSLRDSSDVIYSNHSIWDELRKNRLYCCAGSMTIDFGRQRVKATAIHEHHLHVIQQTRVTSIATTSGKT